MRDARVDPPEADRPSYKELEKELARTGWELDLLKKLPVTSPHSSPTVCAHRPMAPVFSGHFNVSFARRVPEQLLRLGRAWSGIQLCRFGSPVLGAHSKFAPGVVRHLWLSAHARLFTGAIWRTHRQASSAPVDAFGGINGYSQETSATTATRAQRPQLVRFATTRFFGHSTESGLSHRHHGTEDRRR